jgi:Xaa-Pro aminopeptidase
VRAPLRRSIPWAAAALLAALVPTTGEAQADLAVPKEVYAARRARLLAEAGDALVVVPGRHLVGVTDLPRQDPDFWYLTGVQSPLAVLAMTPDRSALFLPERFQFLGGQFPMADEAFRRASWNQPRKRLEPGPETARALGIDVAWPLDSLAGKLREMARGRRVVFLPGDRDTLYAPPGISAPLPVEAQVAAGIASLLPGAEVKDVTPLVRRMRLRKDAHEVAALREAARISGLGLVAAMKAVRPGMNDREVVGLMEAVWKENGASRASFGPIVASGDDAMALFTIRGEGYDPVDRVMRAGELLFVDYGAAEVLMYTSDLCRTLPVSGRFTPEQRLYYDIVLEAQEAAIAAVRPGTMMLDIVRAAAAVFRRHGLEPMEDVAQMGEDRVWGIMPSPTHYLARGGGLLKYSASGLGVRDLGHHIGLEATESRDFGEPLQPGWVFTVEPKLYIPEKKIAIMVEDMILVTAFGRENLSADTPKRAEDIERVMAQGRRRKTAP